MEKNVEIHLENTSDLYKKKSTSSSSSSAAGKRPATGEAFQ